MLYKFKVEMTCSGCSNAVTRSLTKSTDIDSFVVSLESQTVTVDSSLPADKVLEIVRKTGKPTTAIGADSK